MNRVLSILALLVWGVWVGGIVTLGMTVATLARTFRTDPALEAVRDDGFGVAAGAVFRVFEVGQLAVAGVALLLVFGWRLCPGAARLKTALFAMLAVATVGAVVEKMFVAPRVEALRVERRTKTPEFDTAHKTSEGIYKGMLVALLAGGALIPFAVVHEERHRRERIVDSTTA